MWPVPTNSWKAYTKSWPGVHTTLSNWHHKYSLSSIPPSFPRRMSTKEMFVVSCMQTLRWHMRVQFLIFELFLVLAKLAVWWVYFVNCYLWLIGRVARQLDVIGGIYVMFCKWCIILLFLYLWLLYISLGSPMSFLAWKNHKVNSTWWFWCVFLCYINSYCVFIDLLCLIYVFLEKFTRYLDRFIKTPNYYSLRSIQLFTFFKRCPPRILRIVP